MRPTSPVCRPLDWPADRHPDHEKAGV